MTDPPRYSVVIPTHNRADVLSRVLVAWERQEPADLRFEIQLVDDGSTDATSEVLAAVRPGRYQLTVHPQAQAGPASARNRALGASRGERVLLCGDDIEPSPTLLHEHSRAHEELADPGVAVLGLIRWPPAAALTATMRHVDGPGAQQFSFHYMQDACEYDFRHFYTSNLSLDRRLLAREPTGFALDFPFAAFEDAELGYRLSRHGMRIVHRVAPVAFHHHHHDVRSFLERQRRCGAMAHVLVRRHPELAQLIGTRELRRLVWRERLASPSRRRRRARLAPLVPVLVEALLDLMADYDAADAPRLPTLLHPLFRYGFLLGLAERALAAASRERVMGGLLLDALAPALRHFLAELAQDGSPPPPAARLAAVQPLLAT